MQLHSAGVDLVGQVGHLGSAAEGAGRNDDVVGGEVTGGGLDKETRTGVAHPQHHGAELDRKVERARVRLEVVGDLILAWEVPWIARERHTG